MDDEFKRSIERQDKANRMSRTGRRFKKSAYDELQEYYRGLIRNIPDEVTFLPSRTPPGNASRIPPGPAWVTYYGGDIR